MKYNEFCGEKVSALGFGTMRLPMDENEKIDFNAGCEMVDYALEHGINYFDTAYKYHQGASEPFCGLALSDRHERSSFFLASKLPTWLCETQEDCKKIFEEQLEKCHVAYFDFYLIHNIDEDTWSNITKLQMGEYLMSEKKAGRIKHLGASVHCQPELLEDILKTYGNILEFVQIQLNYFDWEYQNAKTLYEICEKAGKPVIVMEPLRGGMLSAPASHSTRELLDRTSAECGNSSTSYTDYAFGFVESLDNVHCILSGMSALEQMKENIEFFSGDGLSKEQLAIIPEAAKLLQSDIMVPCTGCNYCFECPSEIKIPKIFKLYNDAAARGFHNIWSSLSGEYKKIGANGKDCIQCGNCEAHCPQNIKIIDLLQVIDKKYEQLAEIGE